MVAEVRHAIACEMQPMAHIEKYINFENAREVCDMQCR